MQDIEDRIREIISQQINIPVEEITSDALINDDLGIDSIDIVQIVMALEEEYNIKIPDEDVDQMIKIKDLVEYINNKLSKRLDETPWKN